MRLWYRFCRSLCHLTFLGFCRGRVFGVRHVPLSGPVLLVCNHQSFLDPVLATLALRRECHYMARDTLFCGGPFERLIVSLNAFPIRRGSADVGAIRETLRRLRQGALITVFPEGTRTPDGRVQEMEPGVVLLARRARAPLVPTLILGAFECWPRRARLPRPHAVIVAYGQPLVPAELSGRTDEECIALVRARILEMRARYERHPLMNRRRWREARSEPRP
jgi:1-acyl-sn-glycerol-3-phosphate acyltransferase